MADIRQQIPDEVIKPGSTAAVASDPSLVVAHSPNSPTPAGSNAIGSVIVTSTPDGIGSGTITAADIVVGAPGGAGLLVSGASTAGSTVTLLCPGGDSAWTIQMLGTFGGTTLYFEESIDSTTGADGNWINVNGRQTGVVNTVLAGGVTSIGIYRGNTAGAKYIRVRAVGRHPAIGWTGGAVLECVGASRGQYHRHGQRAGLGLDRYKRLNRCRRNRNHRTVDGNDGGQLHLHD